MPIPQERRNVPAINKSDLLLEMPQKEQSFIQCVCVCIYIYIYIYIYILPNTVLGGRDKGRKKGLVSAWNSKFQGRQKYIKSLTTKRRVCGNSRAR